MERDIKPLQTIDAKLWADEFMATKQRLGDAEFDHAMMLGWFANAIMRGYDEGKRLGAADAQATIEALQARVRELEQWVQDQSTANLEKMRHMDEMQSRAMDAESQLTQRTAECDALKLVNDTHMKTVMKLSHVVEQRTAELERVRGLVKTYADAKTDFDDKRLQEDHHAWRERYTRLVGAETILIALTATSQTGGAHEL